MGDGAEFDGFGTRSNNQRYTILAQLSPWLRRSSFHPKWTDRQVVYKRLDKRARLFKPAAQGG
jgi:hypothetical protein